ncbi:MAG TPA: TatD family hydrolase, partial [Nitrososphaera sp.]
MLYDAHVHLTDREYSGYILHVLTSLRAMKMVACSVAVDVETSRNSLQLFSSMRDIVRQFVGIHPEFAAKEDPQELTDLFQSNANNVDGVGEIGLDGTYEAERGVSY